MDIAQDSRGFEITSRACASLVRGKGRTTANGMSFQIPEKTPQDCQRIADILAGVVPVPAALVMRLHHDGIEVLISCNSEAKPYHPGDGECAWVFRS